MGNFCNLSGLEQWYFSLPWNTYMWKLQNLFGLYFKQIIAWLVLDIWHKYHSWYFKIVSNFNRLTAREITYNNFEISLVVFMSNITTNHAITYTNWNKQCVKLTLFHNWRYKMERSSKLRKSTICVFVDTYPVMLLTLVNTCS